MRQLSVKSLGNWEQQPDGAWKFKSVDNSYIANVWIESLTEAGAYYYIDVNGVMLVNSKTPDGYDIDGQGIWRAGVMEIGEKNHETQDTSNGVYNKGISDASDDNGITQELLDAIRKNPPTSAYGGLR